MKRCLLFYVVVACAGRPSLSQPQERSQETTQTAPLRATLWPDAKSALPANVAWLVLEFSAPVARERLDALRMVDEGSEISARWVWSAADPEVKGAVLVGPFADPRCPSAEGERLCEGHRYRLRLDEEDLAAFMAGPEERVAPQWLGPGAIEVGDIGVRLTRETDTPCAVSALSLGLLGAPPQEVFEPSMGALIGGLSPDTDYVWALSCTSAAGFGSPTWDIAFRTLPAQELRLSEVVLDPRFDWNDSQEKRGVPFDVDAAPSERASPTDEWVELWNAGPNPVPLRGYSVDVLDGSPAQMSLNAAFAAKESYCPAGCNPLAGNARMVLRLSPSGENAANHATLVLRDALGFERDRVDIEDGDSHSPADEAVAACGDRDSRTWRKAPATPGNSNACP